MVEVVTGRQEEEGPKPIEHPPAVFDEVAAALAGEGAAAGFERLSARLADSKDYGRLFQVLLMKKRAELGLPLHAPNPSDDMAEATRRAYEDSIAESCRKVAGLYLDAGNIPEAWPYLRMIGETEPIVEALEKAEIGTNGEALVDIAFNQGLHPKKGFEWILDRFGTCNAITTMDQVSGNQPKEIREYCITLLVRRLHSDLLTNVKADIERREGKPPIGDTLSSLIAARPWLFDDHNYHIDASHLSSVARMALVLPKGPDLDLAIELCEYGRHLTADWQYAGSPPFEKTYVDCGIYLKAIAGTDPDGALKHFRGKITPDDPDGTNTYCAQVLVDLLVRLGRYVEALTTFDELKADAAGPPVACPAYPELCRLAGRPDKWAEYARNHGDIVSFAAALAGKSGR
jgi:hypothetical protein